MYIAMLYKHFKIRRKLQKSDLHKLFIYPVLESVQGVAFHNR